MNPLCAENKRRKSMCCEFKAMTYDCVWMRGEESEPQGPRCVLVCYQHQQGCRRREHRKALSVWISGEDCEHQMLLFLCRYIQYTEISPVQYRGTEGFQVHYHRWLCLKENGSIVSLFTAIQNSLKIPKVLLSAISRFTSGGTMIHTRPQRPCERLC